ncbi:glyoxalase [Methylobacterium sp. Leaf99]|uniref:VOC family protein n=1 Tax=Methylobacterium sp. Leaf99 TaxID=1736251 RepID=UPI0006FCEDF5|nr:VOC family protein [Methylobacterium sp. Leaf99]KQP10089.1 glyoxalase [Methylobacterium sp. Leaf99]
MTIPRTRYRCDHVHLRSRDAVAAGAFYVEILGAREIGREGVPVSRVILDIGGLTLFIEQAPDGLAPSAQAPHLGIEHIGLAVEDIEATHADLRRRNATIVSGITDVRAGLRVLFIEGPDAVRIEFLQRSDAP